MSFHQAKDPPPGNMLAEVRNREKMIEGGSCEYRLASWPPAEAGSVAPVSPPPPLSYYLAR